MLEAVYFSVMFVSYLLNNLNKFITLFCLLYVPAAHKALHTPHHHFPPVRLLQLSPPHCHQEVQGRNNLKLLLLLLIKITKWTPLFV